MLFAHYFARDHSRVFREILTLKTHSRDFPLWPASGTGSRAFSNTALQCTIAELGVEKILFAVDWPFMPNVPGRKFMDACAACSKWPRRC